MKLGDLQAAPPQFTVDPLTITASGTPVQFTVDPLAIIEVVVSSVSNGTGAVLATVPVESTIVIP